MNLYSIMGPMLQNDHKTNKQENIHELQQFKEHQHKQLQHQSSSSQETLEKLPHNNLCNSIDKFLVYEPKETTKVPSTLLLSSSSCYMDCLEQLTKESNSSCYQSQISHKQEQLMQKCEKRRCKMKNSISTQISSTKIGLSSSNSALSSNNCCTFDLNNVSSISDNFNLSSLNSNQTSMLSLSSLNLTNTITKSENALGNYNKCINKIVDDDDISSTKAATIMNPSSLMTKNCPLSSPLPLTTTLSECNSSTKFSTVNSTTKLRSLRSSTLNPSSNVANIESLSSSPEVATTTSTSLISSSAEKSTPTTSSASDLSHLMNSKNRRRQLRRRRRGRLRKLYDMGNAIISLLLLLIPSSFKAMVHKCIESLSKFYRYMIVFMSKRLVSQILWIIGIAIAVIVLPINLVNATSSSSSSLLSFSLTDYDDKQYNLEEFSYNSTKNTTGTIFISNHTEEVKKPLFPPDLFTREQLEQGAVAFYIMGVIYMFVALAIVCDEFFVPSLDVIIEKLDITDDVAGATFMAAGGSAPELFTSVIGVFVSFDDVGIGTIVGSAVFNILFVIGMCALFSKTVLTLTWWPLFRDCSFYSVSLLILIYFFRDNLIYWWEALVLFSIYIAYVGFMKWNQQVERCVKKVIYKNKVTRVRSTDQLMPAGNAANSSETSMATQPGGSVTSRAASETRSGPPGSSTGAGNSSSNAGSTVTGAKFRHGLLQLMIHTIDPLHDDDVPGKVDEKATQLHAIASLKVLLDATKPQRGAATTSAANHVKINLKETTLASDRPNGNIDTTIDSPSVGGRRPSWIEQRMKLQTRRFSTKANDLEDEPEALSMSWPDTGRKRLTYLLVAPILFPLWLTLPDTRTPRGKKYFPVTFIGSILWIAAYSYLMVWWANVAGDTARIPPEVMGLTFLAAGTSIPDLITSVIVARKGFGDMAVSSSVGSNIFDVTVGLPIPWFLYGIIYQQPVEVNSVGMVCSITILFMMLLFVIMSIACFRWRMNRGLGLTMFLLYFVFVAVSLMFEYKIIVCPV